MSKEPTVPFGAAHRLPNEILQSIYGLLSPWEFQHARSTCHYWRQASLDSRLLTTQIRRGGWVGVLEGYTVTKSGDIATLSRLLARECSLSAHADHGPDATASDNESHSPFRVTTTVDFSTLINRHEQVTYTLSVCKGYLLVAQDALVHLFSFQDLSLHFVTTLKFPDHVDLVSMDVSEGRYEVAALLQRAGTVMVVNPDCRSPAQDMRTSEKPQNNAAVLQASRSVLESPSGTLNRRTISSMYNKARNWARFRPRDRCLRERDPPASESSTSLQNVTDQQQDEPASEALSFMRRIRDLRLALTPSTSHSITDMFIFDPEQNIAIDEMVIGSKSDGIAFVITQSQAVQLYWEKYLLGEGSVFDLPCTCSRYGLYFVPRELLNDFERSWPNVSGSSTTVVLVSEVPPLEINLMPLSDGVNLLYTDLETHLLNLSYARFPSYLEMVAPECIATKRTVLIRGSADAAQFNENERRKPPCTHALQRSQRPRQRRPHRSHIRRRHRAVQRAVRCPAEVVRRNVARIRQNEKRPSE